MEGRVYLTYGSGDPITAGEEWQQVARAREHILNSKYGVERAI